MEQNHCATDCTGRRQARHIRPDWHSHCMRQGRIVCCRMQCYGKLVTGPIYCLSDTRHKQDPLIIPKSQCRRKTFMVHQTFVWWALSVGCSRQFWRLHTSPNLGTKCKQYLHSKTWIFINWIWIATRFRDCQIWGTGSGNSAILAP